MSKEDNIEQEDVGDDKTSQIDPNANHAASIMRLGAFNSQAKVVEAGGKPYIVVPKDFDVLAMDAFMKNPSRINADMTFDYWDDFVAYVKRFKTENTVAFFFYGVIMVVFDYHTKDTPGWLAHKVRYNCDDKQKLQKYVGKFRDDAQLPVIFGAYTSGTEPKPTE
jgi:uncharacterized protein YfdQ (DUF2303 family)